MTAKKLPVWATVREAYASVKEHTAELVLLSRGTSIAVLVTAVLTFAAVQLMTSDARRAQAFLDLPAAERVALYTSLAALVAIFGVFAIVVRWHRMILRDLPPDATRPGATRAGLLYFMRSLLLSWLGLAIAAVCGLLPVTLIRGLAISDDVRALITVVCVAAGVTAALLIVGRLSLILPAGAVGDYKVNFRRSWEISRGNSWRILAGSLLSSGPVFVANIMLNGLIDGVPSMPAGVPSLLAMFVLSLLLLVVTAVVQASFLSYAYKSLAT